MKVISSPTDLSTLGPLRISEPWFARRLRLHQAWYRQVVLGLDAYGQTRPPHSRPLGSILAPEDADAGLNFLSTDALELFASRHASGWGIDPVRTRAYLTSSQGLTLNIVGPLERHHAWLIAVLNAVRPSAPRALSVNAVRIEYAAGIRPDGLGDRTTADVLVDVETEAGPVVIVIETKLGDRFNSRAINLGDGYASVSHLWSGKPISADSPVNQLARLHALGEWAGTRKAPHAELLLLRHVSDRKAEVVADTYRGKLQDPGLFHDVTLDAFFECMAATATTSTDRELAVALDLRYAQLQPSEELWTEFLATFPRAGRGTRAHRENG